MCMVLKLTIQLPAPPTGDHEPEEKGKKKGKKDTVPEPEVLIDTPVQITVAATIYRKTSP